MRVLLVIFALLLSGAPLSAHAETKRILFVGNSLTHGAYSSVRTFRPHSITDLSGAGVGGVPALFKAFTKQAGLFYDVSSLTKGGENLAYHYTTSGTQFDRRWDAIVLQEATAHINSYVHQTGYRSSVQLITQRSRRANPGASIHLVATWSRADLVYRKPGKWRGRPIGSMGVKAQSLSESVGRQVGHVSGIIPVGIAWNKAISTGIAKANPNDASESGVNLWSEDQHHGSRFGYYLAALVIFGSITGVNPIMLGADEQAAAELKISPDVARDLQQVSCLSLHMKSCGRSLVFRSSNSRHLPLRSRAQ